MELKGIIIGMANANKSAQQIASELDKSHSTVSYIIKYFKKTQSNKNMPRSRHPTLLTKHDKTHLGRITKLNHFKSLYEITNQLPINYSLDTTWNMLREHSINSYTAAKKPNITPANIQKHKNWCQNIGNWSDDEWRKVIWSDESTVELNLSLHKIKVWHMKGEHYQVDCLASNKRSGRIS